LISDILLRIYIYGKTPDSIIGIILIDEFDNHLHPDWQNGIVDKLHQIFPKIQFILTTHNPMAILDREIDEIIDLKVGDNGVEEIDKNMGTKNIDVSIVLLKYFKVKSLVGQTMRENLKEFTRLKRLKNLTSDESKKLKNIIEDLQDTVATNFIYNNQYFDFLKFIKDNPDINFRGDYEKLSDEKRKELLEKIKLKFKKV